MDRNQERDTTLDGRSTTSPFLDFPEINWIGKLDLKIGKGCKGFGDFDV